MACHHMGLLLLYGKDGGYDVPQVRMAWDASHWSRVKIDRADAYALTRSVPIHTSTHIYTQDAKKARGILSQACDEGIPDSCYALASHLLRRPGPDDAKGAKAQQHTRDAVQVGGGWECLHLYVCDDWRSVGAIGCDRLRRADCPRDE